MNSSDMRNACYQFCLLFAFVSMSNFADAQQKAGSNRKQKTLCNPVNLSYRFCLDSPSRREAADPSMVVFKGEYYLFASKSGGYFHSKDLLKWDLITTKDLPLEDYAPTAVVLNDTLYFMASAQAPVKIYKTANPKSGKWQVANAAFPIGMIDPDLFVDDDGKLFFYYGCSDVNPLYAVELDTKTLNPIGKPVPIFNSNRDVNGWERKGDYNDAPGRPWIEGSWMTKYKGKYYLQYAGPGTEYKSYSDGVYVADRPLGPFTIAPNNPFSYRPEGFIAGAGHSSTFQDKYGNYWRISTMTISQKHMFERRLGIFPAFFDQDGELHTNTAFGDFPFTIPLKKITNADEIFPGWMLLSYKKPVTVSSELPNHPKAFAADEEIRSYWSAATGNQGEWISIDLEKECTVNAIQINFAENETKLFGRSGEIFYQYVLEYSSDNKNWGTAEDKRQNNTDVPHDYIEFKKPIKARYIRLTNYHVPSGTFALAGLRIFGNARSKAPNTPGDLMVVRSETDRCVATVKWTTIPGAVGYNIRYGTAPDKLYQTYQVLGASSVTIKSLNSSAQYFFTIDCFNENAVTKGKETITVN